MSDALRGDEAGRGEEAIDRSGWPVRVSRLHDVYDEIADEIADHAHLTPSQRIEMVDELTRTAWAFSTGSSDEPEFRRDVVRVVRRGR